MFIHNSIVFSVELSRFHLNDTSLIKLYKDLFKNHVDLSELI